MEEQKNPIQSAERIFRVMETLAETGPIGLVELSNMLELHKSTTHRLLNSLASMNYVRQDSENGKYMLTFKVLEIAGKLLNKVDVLSIAHPCLVRLAEQVGETVHLVQRQGNQMVYIDKVESDVNSIRMGSKIGTSIDMYCSGVGKAVLSTLPSKEVEMIWKQTDIHALTPKTITSLDELQASLKQVRQQGYAVDDEENEEGVRCIAACIRDYTGEAVNAFSISAPVNRMTDERIRELSVPLLEIKAEISRELGYRTKIKL